MAKKLRNRLLILLTEKERNERRRISQTEVAQAIGVSNNTITNWIRHDLNKLDVNVVERLCEYFECDLGDLLYFEESNEGHTSSS